MTAMTIYTIGFARKSARQFFGLLSDNGIQRLVDIRLFPGGQLSGFARQEDLPYFLEKLANNCRYVYTPELAPTREMLSDYRSSPDWENYVLRFQALMDERHIPEILDHGSFLELKSCLLCSEATPEKCHRRLVAERMAARWPGVTIVHL